MSEDDAVRDEYAHLAGYYDQRWSAYLQQSLSLIMGRLLVAGRERVLDVGCGTGLLLQNLHQQYPQLQLHGFDLTPEMLAQARQRLPSSVQLYTGNSQQLPFADNSFELLVCSSMFHYIRQPLATLREMHRVLVPGGRLLLSDWCRDFLSMKLLDMYLQVFSPAHYRTYGSVQMKKLLDDAGFHADHAEKCKISSLWGLMLISACK